MSYDDDEKRAAYCREHPIWGTDLSRPLPEIIEKIRRDLTEARGALSDIRHGFRGWGEWVEPVEGLLTCGLVTLYDIRERMLAAEAKAKE